MKLAVGSVVAAVCLPVCVAAQSLSLSAAEIRAVIVGKRIQTQIVTQSIEMTYGANGRYEFVAGRGAGTVIGAGGYEISDGQICHTPDNRSNPGTCQKVTREGGTYYFTSPKGEKRKVTIFN